MDDSGIDDRGGRGGSAMGMEVRVSDDMDGGGNGVRPRPGGALVGGGA